MTAIAVADEQHINLCTLFILLRYVVVFKGTIICWEMNLPSVDALPRKREAVNLPALSWNTAAIFADDSHCRLWEENQISHICVCLLRQANGRCCIESCLSGPATRWLAAGLQKRAMRKMGCGRGWYTRVHISRPVGSVQQTAGRMLWCTGSASVCVVCWARGGIGCFCGKRVTLSSLSNKEQTYNLFSSWQSTETLALLVWRPFWLSSSDNSGELA